MNEIKEAFMLRFLLILSLLAFASCSASKKSKDVATEEQGIEVSDADEFLEEDSAGEVASEKEGEDDLFADDQEEPAEKDAVAEDAGEEQLGEPVAEEPASDDMFADDSSSSPAPVAMSGDVKTYTVQEGETLMMISFKLYGDYLKWREISNLNSDIITDGQTVTAGMEIKYSAPAEEFVWNPSGNPYLIKWGDTLGRISNNVYGDMGKWKSIWQNNKPLIRNPDKIYAGFTIYTPEEDDQMRDLANEGI
jgi:nucleoid-associated protein YgaU